MTVAVLFVLVAFVVIAARELSTRRELKRLRRDLASAQAQLAERAGLSTVGEMVSGLAQELKRPLQGMLGNSELMLATSGTAKASAEELRQIRDDAARAVGIVRDLLAVTETVSLSCRWQDVNEVVSRAIASCSGESDRHGVKIGRAPTERLPLVYVDGRQLEKVVAALMMRALPAGDGASARPSRSAPSVVTVKAHRVLTPEDRVIITIEDDGPTDSTDDEALGPVRLAACRRIVGAHGGSLAVTPLSSRRGIRIAIELPVIPAATLPPASATPTVTVA